MRRMRRRVALFSNGWSDEYLEAVGSGAVAFAKTADIDVFAFVDFSVRGENDSETPGEFQIFTLPDLKDFDGALLLPNTFNLDREVSYLQKQIKESGIPAISLEYKLDGMDYLGTDNYSGMYELTEHLIQKHGAKNLVFIGGFEEHADCRIRLDAVRDAARKNGVELPGENILFADWSADVATACAERWIKDHSMLPDVFVCANDIMAMGVCDWLKERGYRVTEDVKVTGYDCLKTGQESQPVLTTVSHEWDRMGYDAMRRLVEKMEGKPGEKEVVLNTSLICGESCGCHADEDTLRVNMEKKRVPNEKRNNGFASDSHFRHMYIWIRKADKAGDLNYCLACFLGQENWMEGDNFMLCLNPAFFDQNISDDAMRQLGYGREIDVIIAMHNGISKVHQRMETRRAIFRAAEESDTPGLYLFVPLINDDLSVGFAMLSRNFDIVIDNLLYIWTRHMNQYLEQVRSNVKIAELTRKLSELSVTDGLTGAYNRMGCEKVLYPFMEECQKRGGKGVLMIADVDDMKRINDGYGHNQGDVALCVVVEALRDALPRGYMIARFGGDEFLMVGEDEGRVSQQEVMDAIQAALEKKVADRGIPFPISLSVGCVQLEPGEAFSQTDCLQRADEEMYRQKRLHHAGRNQVK